MAIFAAHFIHLLSSSGIMFKQLIATALLVATCGLRAEDSIQRFTQNNLLQNANISLLVRDLNTGEVLSDYRSNSVATPASTMKVVTTATILELLGPDYCFQTRLYTDGTISADSTLNGNLYLRGGGDPTLGSDKLGEKDFFPKWIAALRAAGIRTIRGQIISDESIFEDQVINPKWTWEDMGNYYAPGIHGISYLDNTFRMYFRSGKAGSTPEILRTEPEIDGLKMNNQLKAANIGSDNGYFYGAPYSLYRSIYGEIPANRNEFVVKGDIPDPALMLAQHLQQRMTAAGLTVSNQPTVATCNYDDKKLIYTHCSPPLRDIITETNVKSNNHFAEYLFKTIGLQKTTQGSTRNAIATIRAFWKDKGLPINQLFQHDGSGLSPCDAVSARFFVDLLSYMRLKSNFSTDFYNSLPVSGGRGTLSTLLVKTPLEGKVHAKSGTIESVKCYAGYIELSTRTLVFAILVNNPDGSHKQVIRKMEELLLDITRDFNR